jgi:hypothetical protein
VVVVVVVVGWWWWWGGVTAAGWQSQRSRKIAIFKKTNVNYALLILCMFTQ